MRLQRRVTIHFTPSLTPSLLWFQSFPSVKIFNKLPDFSWYGLQPFIIIITLTLVSRQCTEKHFRSNIISGTSQRHFHFLYACWKALFLYSRLTFTSFSSDHHALYSFKLFLNNIFNFRVFPWNPSHFPSCAAAYSFSSSIFNYYLIKRVAPFFVYCHHFH